MGPSRSHSKDIGNRASIVPSKDSSTIFLVSPAFPSEIKSSIMRMQHYWSAPSMPANLFKMWVKTKATPLMLARPERNSPRQIHSASCTDYKHFFSLSLLLLVDLAPQVCTLKTRLGFRGEDSPL